MAKKRNVFRQWYRGCAVAILILGLTACGGSSEGDLLRGALESAPVDLSGEQVTLTQAQLECGAKSELWDPPSGNIAKLEQKGRDLKFNDDIRLSDPDIGLPYTQVTGALPVRVYDLSKIRDADNGKKLADVKLGVVINHECFAAPLPLMGVKKGKFAPDAPVVFRFQGSDKEWTLDKLVH